MGRDEYTGMGYVGWGWGCYAGVGGFAGVGFFHVGTGNMLGLQVKLVGAHVVLKLGVTLGWGRGAICWDGGLC